MSQQIARLEAEVGTVLVVRTRRGIRLTEAGEALLVPAERILEDVRDARAELAALAALSAERLRFGSFPTATQSVLAHLVTTFRARHPDIELVIVDDKTDHLLARLRDGALGLARRVTSPRTGCSAASAGTYGDALAHRDQRARARVVAVPVTPEGGVEPALPAGGDQVGHPVGAGGADEHLVAQVLELHRRVRQPVPVGTTTT